MAEEGQDDPNGEARAVTGAGTPPPLMPATHLDDALAEKVRAIKARGTAK